MNKKLYADRLSDLVLNLGVALKKGEHLNIAISPDAYYYAQNMAIKAYEMGAGYVNISVSDLLLDKYRAYYQEMEDLTYIPSFMKEFVKEGIQVGIKNVRIECRDERIGLPELDDNKYQALSSSVKIARRDLTKLYMENHITWCVCCAPGNKWAKAVLGEDKTEEDLADILASILHIDTPDYLSYWKNEDKKVKERIQKINDLEIKTLHFKSKETDFSVGFRKEAKFEGCSSLTTKGECLYPNFPTLEIFNTPDKDTAQGYISTTRPVSVMGNETEGVKLFFENGKCIKAEAKVGQETMDNYLEIDEGSSRLGEIALVDDSSAISRTGLVFGSILIDENASCHIALGSGYTSNLEIGDKDPKDYGCNMSLVHTDFMVGSSDMRITATTYKGEEVLIMDKGNFVF